MRILFAHENCGYFGGVEQNLADSSKLRLAGHRCFLAWTRATDRSPDEFSRLFDETAPCLELGAAGGEPLRELLARWRPDVVYLHKVPAVGSLLPHLDGLYTVSMVHDHELTCPREHKYFLHSGRVCGLAAGWRCYADGAFLARSGGPLPVQWVSIGKKMAEMRENRRLDRLIVASAFMRDELVLNGFPADRVAILPPAVDMRSVSPSEAPGEGRVLYVGQLIRGKGVDLLLDAMATVRCSFKLDIVGTGNASESLRRHAERRGLLPDRVAFHGWIPSAVQGDLYRACDVAVVPSRWPEPFGMVGLQAMRHGRPVVAFDVGGIREWLDHGQTGYLVPEQDTRVFGMAVARLLQDSDLARRLGRRAHAVASEKFAFTRYLQDLEHVLTPPPVSCRVVPRAS